MKYFTLLCSILISGCASTSYHPISEVHSEKLHGEWERKPSRHMIQSIRFEPDLSCSTYQKNGHEGLITSCRYVRNGKRVTVFDVNPITGQDTGNVTAYEYEQTGEKIFIYRGIENEENSLVYLKIEN